MNERRLQAMDMEELASRFLDGELKGEDREAFLSLIDEEPCSRRLLSDFREQDRCLAENPDMAPPPCPELPHRGFSLRWILVPAVAGTLAVLFFAAGVYFGERRGVEGIPSFARVADPVVWTAGARSFEGEGPFSSLTGLMAHYQAEIGRELEKTRPDWDRVRDLMVTLGSLRTDLELLSLHERYQQDPSGGAASWRKMLGITEEQTKSL